MFVYTVVLEDERSGPVASRREAEEYAQLRLRPRGGSCIFELAEVGYPSIAPTTMRYVVPPDPPERD